MRESKIMTYYESAEGVEISRDRVVIEFAQHGFINVLQEFKEFCEFYGYSESESGYSASKVLAWLGY